MVLLCAIFGVEFSVMLILPRLLPAHSSLIFAALVDACFLTAILAPVIWLLVVRPLRQLAELRLRLFAAILSAQEDERRRIARDLHDELGQSLTRLLVGLRTIEEFSKDSQVCQMAHDLRQIGTDTHAEIRRLSRGLRPQVLDDMGLFAALERLLADLVAIHDVDARLDDDSDDGPRLPAQIETVLFRIAQEALTNAVRHGQATEIRLGLKITTDAVNFTIRDNGRGFDPIDALQRSQSSNPFGLLAMHERAALCDGRVMIQSQPGTGTQITVRIPLSNSENHS